MPDRLLLTKNAQFYVPRQQVTDEAIHQILNAASENIEANSQFMVEEFRIERNFPETNESYKYSALVYRTLRPVYFLDQEVFDKVHAYIVIFEIDNHIAVLKKSCANTSEAIDSLFDQVSSALLTSTFDDDLVDFQKISIRNMTVSDRALRARSYEAADLKGLLSTHAAGRSIPYFLKIRQGQSLKSISAHSGRVVESSIRLDIDAIASWLKAQIRFFNFPLQNKHFLNSFAKLVELNEVLNVTSPSAIMIESSTLYDQLIETETPMKYRDSTGKETDLTTQQQERFFQRLEEVYEINDDLTIKGYEKTAKLRKNLKSITLTSKVLRQIILVEDGIEISLQKYIVKNGLFTICFKDPRYMYFMGRCFQDVSGVSEIPNILEILIPLNALSTTTSEKGSFHVQSTIFDPGSIFGQIEIKHSSDDFIFCDDLGIEWADHITFNKTDSCIAFIHSKFGETSKSASKLHDVVGQGIKNLGNMFFTKEKLLDKFNSKFNLLYSNDGVQSQITRVRKGNATPAQFENYLIDLLKDYRLHRKCILACSFISKTQISAEFAKITAGQPVAGNIIQLLWIISSFAHAAKDANIIPIIYCKP